MLDRTNSKLHVRFAIWFLLVALLPLIGSGIFYLQLQQWQTQRFLEREMVLIARLKEDRLRMYVDDMFEVLQVMVTHNRSALLSRDWSRVSYNALAEAHALTSSDVLVFVDDGGTVHSLGDAASDTGVAAWRPNPGLAEDQFTITADSVIAVRPFDAGGWLMLQKNISTLDEVLFSGINDAQYFNPRDRSESSMGLGGTADIFLSNYNFDRLTSALGISLGMTTLRNHTLVRSWLGNPEIASMTIRSKIQSKDILTSIRKVDVGGNKLILIMTLDWEDALAQLGQDVRLAVVVYLLILAAVLVLLYFFVNMLSRILIRPIYASIIGLQQTSQKMRTGIDAAETAIAKQGEVAKNLVDIYRAQGDKIQKVHRAISALVDAMVSIRKQSQAMTTRLHEVDERATDGQRQAGEAKTGIAGIKRLTSANQALLVTLESYSEEVNSIADDVHKLSHAIGYLSLNAGIQASKTDVSLHDLSSLVAEVVKLSRMSRDASVKIGHLVERIKANVVESKQSAGREQHEAERSLVVIDRALDGLNKISKETLALSKNMRLIDEQVIRESESTDQIALGSNELLQEAKKNAREATVLNKSMADQQIGLKNNISAMRKLVMNVSKLAKLIGAEEQANAETKKK